MPHAPSCLTAALAQPAAQALLYVVPLTPHTGAKSAVHMQPPAEHSPALQVMPAPQVRSPASPQLVSSSKRWMKPLTRSLCAPAGALNETVEPPAETVKVSFQFDGRLTPGPASRPERPMSHTSVASAS